MHSAFERVETPPGGDEHVDVPLPAYWRSLTNLVLWLVETTRKLARFLQVQTLFFSTANIRFPHLGVTSWPCGKGRTNLLSSLPRWKVQSRQIFLENRTEGIVARMAAYKLVLIRHGESCWNQENRFCGWYDADLSETGEQEAKRGGQALKGNRLRNRPGAAFYPCLD